MHIYTLTCGFMCILYVRAEYICMPTVYVCNTCGDTGMCICLRKWNVVDQWLPLGSPQYLSRLGLSWDPKFTSCLDWLVIELWGSTCFQPHRTPNSTSYRCALAHPEFTWVWSDRDWSSSLYSRCFTNRANSPARFFNLYIDFMLKLQYFYIFY